ncbi:hypothetical protein Tco_0417126 [Tanacetum coccineum]
MSMTSRPVALVPFQQDNDAITLENADAKRAEELHIKEGMLPSQTANDASSLTHEATALLNNNNNNNMIQPLHNMIVPYAKDRHVHCVGSLGILSSAAKSLGNLILKRKEKNMIRWPLHLLRRTTG